MCFLSNNIYDYYNVSQGKITIPNVDDGEECLATDVSPNYLTSPNVENECHLSRSRPVNSNHPVNSTPYLWIYHFGYSSHNIGDVDHASVKCH